MEPGPARNRDRVVLGVGFIILLIGAWWPLFRHIRGERMTGTLETIVWGLMINLGAILMAMAITRIQAGRSN